MAFYEDLNLPGLRDVDEEVSQPGLRKRMKVDLGLL
jgi:hypothetical protein